MDIRKLYNSYLNGFQEIANYKINDFKTNLVGMLKIVSYFTVVIPLSFAALYGAASLFGRVSKKESLSPQDKNVDGQAQRILIKRTEEIDTRIELSGLPQVELSDVLNTYNERFKPQANQQNLQEYSRSEDYRRHATTARIYFNSSQLSELDALRIVFQREPTNIFMGRSQYDETKLKELFGYKKGIYNDLNAKKSDGSSFRDLPNSATVYSETYLWSPPGGKDKKEIACLSLPAPALDTYLQPHYAYYMEKGSLETEKYENEIGFLFKTIEKVVRDNKDSAFNGQGIKRVVLSKFGQSAFLEALSNNDQKIAHQSYKRQMSIFLENIQDTGLKIVMSEYKDPLSDVWHDQMIIGDIINTAEERDLIINAWDPHSAPGNGNDADPSFDGAMGKASGILLTQTSWLNETLRSSDALVAV